MVAFFVPSYIMPTAVFAQCQLIYQSTNVFELWTSNLPILAPNHHKNTTINGTNPMIFLNAAVFVEVVVP